MQQNKVSRKSLKLQGIIPLFLDAEQAQFYSGLSEIGFKEAEKLGLVKREATPGSSKGKYSSIKILELHQRILSYNEAPPTDMGNKDWKILELFANSKERYQQKYTQLKEVV